MLAASLICYFDIVLYCLVNKSIVKMHSLVKESLLDAWYVVCKSIIENDYILKA